ncbi:MAG: efflux RND transporter periplasmic adaptor subunit [Steroidobacteraceae bacterium]
MNSSELLKEIRIDRSGDGNDGNSAMRRWWILAALAVLVALALAFLFLRKPALEVDVVQAETATADKGAGSVLDATGYVVARRQATVSAKVTGKVSEVLIEEGMHVKQGDIMARLDDADARSQLELANAQVFAARSQADEISANLASAQRDLKRQEELTERKLTSLQNLDAARTLVDALTARLQSQRRLAGVAEEQRAVAQVQLDNTVVRAPFDGVVTVKAAQPGEMVSPLSAGGGFTRTGIGTLVDMNSLEIEVDVNESYINRVRPGQAVEAVLNAYPDWVIPAEVIAIIPTADRAKATVKVRIGLKIRDERLVPEMGVRVAFLQDANSLESAAANRPAVLVPASALRDDGGTDIVFIVRDGKALRRAVTAGTTMQEQRQILGGVSPGDKVIVAPPAGLADGTAVRVRQTN